MAAPTSPLDLNTTASSNGPDGATEQVSVLDDYIRGLSASVKHLVVKGADIPSAGTITPAATASFFDITGTTGITAIGSTNSWDGRIVWFQFDGALTITHASTLQLPGNANITTAAGDIAAFYQETSGTWRCLSYQRDAQPSFRATLGSSQTSGTTIVFGTEAHDNGGDYDNTTGIFTAPIAGDYLVSWGVTFQNTTGSLQNANTLLYVAGSAVHAATNNSLANNEVFTSCGSVIIRLAATNQVRVDSVSTLTASLSALSTNGGSWFSAKLL